LHECSLHCASHAMPGARAVLLRSCANGLMTKLHHATDVVLTMKVLSTGSVTGFVSVAAGAATIDSWAALLIGAAGAAVAAAARSMCTQFRLHECRGSGTDHFVGGCVALIAAGLFSRPEYVALASPAAIGHPGGVFFGGHGTNLWVQLLAMFTLAAWGTVGGALLAAVLAAFDWVRPPLHSDARRGAAQVRSCYATCCTD
jgi:ammonia channel protein AmtB